MSGTASKKHKKYMLMMERKRQFGNISAKGDNGVTDLTAYGAAKGEIITNKSVFDPARVTKIKQKNKKKVTKRSTLK